MKSWIGHEETESEGLGVPLSRPFNGLSLRDHTMHMFCDSVAFSSSSLFFPLKYLKLFSLSPTLSGNVF